MIVKVLGIGRPNRGAELMLAAIEESVAEMWPGAIVVTSTSSDIFVKVMFYLRRRIKLPLLPYKLCDIPSLLPKALRSLLDIRADADVNVFLDSSGFAYGDQWGVDKLRQRITYTLPHIKRSGRTFIVLPQALGPFTNNGFKSDLAILIAHADVVFARDQISLHYLEEIIGVQDNVVLSPDFTNLIVPKSEMIQAPGDLAIIPNSKMMEMKAVSDEANYITALLDAVTSARTLGYQPFLLNHEGIKDLRLIKKINDRLITYCRYLTVQTLCKLNR